jgi:threonyl-tRNA synthetase
MNAVKIGFPDGKSEEFSKGISAMEIAEKIGPRLAMAAVAAKVNGTLVDLSHRIDSDSQLQIITGKDKEGLEVIRHSAAHLFAQALLRMYPECKLTIGPVVEDGFYYDIDSDKTFSPADFPAIEAEMEKIVHEDLPVYREELSKHDALKLFADNEYKVEMINEMPGGEKISVYTQGEFKDLCRGPHVPRTSRLKAVKLSKVAGAYWRANSNNKQLQRIYGYAFAEKKDLDEYLKLLEEAEKRDHRKIGREQGLFVFSELVGAGLPLWTPNGTILRDELDRFIWDLRRVRGYKKVTIPHITKKDLYETSGHWAKFSEDLFKINTREGHLFAMKPMNCPHHTQIYAGAIRSYRDLPHRYAETTMVYRDEYTGELSGLSRVRCITQDDAHVFCRKSQVQEEFLKVWDIIDEFYPKFGFKLRVRLSLHDPDHPEKYLGTKEVWTFAETALREMANSRGAVYTEAAGEAAFYGPKIDFMATDSMNREWQVATIQLDMNMPESFDLYCISESGEKERIVMIHAAIMGSIERFCSVLIEHLAGKFPLWLSPVQIKLLPIADRHVAYCQELKAEMDRHGLRVEIDERTESTPKKVRDAQLMNIPLMITIGDKEIDNHTLAVRTLDGKVKFGVVKEAFIHKIVDLVKNRSLTFEI